MKPARLPLPPQLHRGGRASGPRPGLGSLQTLAIPSGTGTPPLRTDQANQPKEIEMNENPCPGHVVTCGSCQGSGRDHLVPLIDACKICEGVGSVLLTPKSS